MDNETLLNEIRLRRNLQSMIKHLAMLAARIFEIEKNVAEIKAWQGREK